MAHARDTRRKTSRRAASWMLALVSWIAAVASHADVAAGDRAWAARAELLDGERAEPARIEEAIGHYRAALEAEPASLEARWKLLRALHYAIDFTSLPDDAQDARVREAVELVRASADSADAGEATDADRALYQAKKQGRNRTVVVDLSTERMMPVEPQVS